MSAEILNIVHGVCRQKLCEFVLFFSLSYDLLEDPEEAQVWAKIWILINKFYPGHAVASGFYPPYIYIRHI